MSGDAEAMISRIQCRCARSDAAGCLVVAKGNEMVAGPSKKTQATSATGKRKEPMRFYPRLFLLDCLKWPADLGLVC